MERRLRFGRTVKGEERRRERFEEESSRISDILRMSWE